MTYDHGTTFRASLPERSRNVATLVARAGDWVGARGGARGRAGVGPGNPRAGQLVQPRVEKDLLGEKEIPGDAYYGVQTLRALENFKLSGITIDHYPGFVEAWAMVKLAAARANTEVGAMKPDRLAAIEKATQAVLAGKYHDQFVVDWYQGGAGTSTNMNANEVLANIGLEMTGHKKGEYQFLEPHDDLNMSQSTNDSYPTAIKVALLLRNDKLIEELQQLVASFRMKADAYIEVVKMGRTEMQDAVPMTVGQEFHAFASSLEGEIQNLRRGGKEPLQRKHGRNGHRHRHQRAQRLPRTRRRRAGQAHRKADRAGERHAGRHLGSAGIRDLFLGAEEPCDQALQDLGRSHPADVRATCGPVGNQSACDTAGLLHHAGQGEPRRARGDEPRHLPCDGQ